MHRVVCAPPRRCDAVRRGRPSGEIRILATDVPAGHVGDPALAPPSSETAAAAPKSTPTPLPAPALEVAQHARPPAPAAATVTATATAAVPRSAKAATSVTRPTPAVATVAPFRERTVLRTAAAVAIWLLHSALWLFNAYKLALTDNATLRAAGSAVEDGVDGIVPPAPWWATGWVEYATALHGQASTLLEAPYPQMVCRARVHAAARVVGPPALTILWRGGGAGHVVEPLQPVLATWLVVEVTLFALIVRAEGRGKPETARGSWLGRALWLWQHRADVLAVGQDAAVLLFLVVMTGVAHQAGLVALAATL